MLLQAEVTATNQTNEHLRVIIQIKHDCEQEILAQISELRKKEQKLCLRAEHAEERVVKLLYEQEFNRAWHREKDKIRYQRNKEQNKQQKQTAGATGTAQHGGYGGSIGSRAERRLRGLPYRI